MIKPKNTLKRDPNQLTLIFREIISRLSSEFPPHLDVPNLFISTFGSPIYHQKEKSGNISAAYLLITQIILYQILSGKRKDLPKIKINSLSSNLLTSYFEKALKITHSPLFKPIITKGLDRGTFTLLEDSIKEIINLRLELLQYEVLAQIFNSLIPFSLRKRIGAYYSGIKTAKLLSHLAIRDPSVKIFDPACGSGALLIASYQRKKELTELTGNKFTITDHKRFLSSEITGIDIMPFAIHLSAIHLALQAPFWDIRQNRLAVHDSIFLNPKSRLQEFLSQKKNISTVDLVIMNPPFVRQESMKKIRPSYKNELHQIFEEYSLFINKKMSYYCYFLFLADKFLQLGGKIAAVIPASFLRVDTTFKVRKWLLKQYNIQYIICQQDKPNFSEDTAFREILLIATKNGPTAEIEYIIVKDLEETESFEKIPDSWRIRKISYDELSSNNLFLPIATMTESNLLEIWQRFSKQKDLVSIDIFLRSTKTGLKRGIETSGGFKIRDMVINEFRSKYLRPNDIWVYDNESHTHVKSIDRYSNHRISIPKGCLIPHLRRMSGECRLDISNKKEYVIISLFPKLEDVLNTNEKNRESISVRLDLWRTYVKERTTNLMVARRFDLSASGTALFSYFSKEKRAPPGVMWSILDISHDDAKILCLFFNCTLNILQIFLNRVETRGAWMQLHEYVIKDLMIPNIHNWSIEKKIPFYQLFDEIKVEEFPPLWQQLAMNISISEINDENYNLLKSQFPKFFQVVGKQFIPRKKIDILFFERLGIKDQNKGEVLLRDMYLSLLIEIALLKKMMK